MLTTQFARRRTILQLAFALALAACGDGGSTLESSDPKTSDGGAGGGNVSSGSNGTMPGGGSSMSTGMGSTGAMVTLPYLVDTDFVASGYMGDSAGIKAAPSLDNDDKTCGGKPAPNGNGSICHSFTYAPSGGEMAWAGVYWQYPANNWTAPGLPIEAGAQKVTFYARADKPLSVEFLAGMNPGPDGFKVSSVLELTTDWAPYELDLSKVTYTKIAGGFGWAVDSTAQSDTGPFTFYVDAITWTK